MTRRSGQPRLWPIAVALLLCLLARPAQAQRRFTFLLPLDQLTPRRDAILSDMTGTVGPGMLGHTHSLQQDEDLHFSLAAPRLQTPVVCELMNAQSAPPPSGEWEQQFRSLFGSGQPITVRGVFRIWPDHPGGNGEAGEGSATSNPGHVVEVHPLAGLTVGSTRLDTRRNIAPITLSGRSYRYKDPGRWGDMLTHRVDADVVQRNGRSYLQLKTDQVGFN